MAENLPAYTRLFVYTIFAALFTWIVAIEAAVDEAEQVVDFFPELIILFIILLLVFIVVAWFERYLRKQLKRWPFWVKTIFPRFTINFILVLIQTFAIVLFLRALWEWFPSGNLPYALFKGDLWLIYAFPFVIFSLVWLVEGALDLFSQRQDLILQNERLEKENLYSQLESLKNQLRPHFLFNNLNTISNLIFKDREKADFFIQKLANIYRYVLEASDEVVTPLSEELKFLMDYIDLQQIRFGDKLIFENHIPKETLDKLIPPLSLELLVENAIKHNRITQEAPLRISLESRAGFLIVTNTYQPRLKSTPTSKKGLANLRQRLKLLGVEDLTVEKDENDFVVRFPMITPES